MPVSLTPRLAAAAEQVPTGARIADVGTDHAYLPAWLLSKGRIAHAIATDLREGPLTRAALTVSRSGVADRVELRLGDGLKPVRPEEVDTVVIAGMGGETILDILTHAPWSAEKLCIVQPMTSAEILRGGVRGLGAHIGAERLVSEGKMLYSILTLRPGVQRELTPGECWAGETQLLELDPLWPRYIERQRRRAEGELAGLKQSSRPADAPRRDYLEEVAAWLRTLPTEQHT